ncbi:MAG: hypothetical protein WCK00_11670 [Deltaproteobacteria bacterium]
MAVGRFHTPSLVKVTMPLGKFNRGAACNDQVALVIHQAVNPGDYRNQ